MLWRFFFFVSVLRAAPSLTFITPSLARRRPLLAPPPHTPTHTNSEYVAVEKVEGTFKKAEPVEQVWVYGNSFKSCLVAVVVPKKEALEAWAKDAGVKGACARVRACFFCACACVCVCVCFGGCCSRARRATPPTRALF